jgi:hypothetical protein
VSASMNGYDMQRDVRHMHLHDGKQPACVAVGLLRAFCIAKVNDFIRQCSVQRVLPDEGRNPACIGMKSAIPWQGSYGHTYGGMGHVATTFGCSQADGQSTSASCCQIR